jgi:glycosyltransferase involved in cell wall biosynthesis
VRVLVTIPVFNEEAQLAQSIKKLYTYLEARCAFDFEVTIADNGSEDRSFAIANRLSEEYANLRAAHLGLKGRGRALRQAWGESEADVLSYMDADLSTDLSAFAPLVQAVASGDFDLATGSRLLPASLTRRCWRRELISRAYNCLVKRLFRTRFSDAQCGFKAISRQAASVLLPLIEDTGWFFDTELLIVAEKSGYRIFDLPVTWTEAADSRVRILSTAWADCRGLLRLRRDLARGRYANLKRGQAVTSAVPRPRRERAQTPFERQTGPNPSRLDGPHPSGPTSARNAEERL